MKDKFIYILAAAVVVIGTSLLLNNRFRAQHSSQKTTPTSEFRVDTENDGVYTNYEYGFRFEYPEELFTLYGTTDKDERGRVARMSDGNINSLGTYHLNVNVDGNFASETFEKYDSLPLEEYECSDEQNCPYSSNRKKIRELSANDAKGFLLYSRYIKGSDVGSATYGNEIYLLTPENNLVNVTLYTLASEGQDTDFLIRRRLEIVDGILQSFEFFAPEY